MHVQELLIYPIKSCAGIKVQEALVTKFGLALPSDPRIFDSFWDDPVLGLRYGDNVSHWLRKFFETEDEFNLVVFDDQHFEGRPCKTCEGPNVARDSDVVAYHDLSPVHLCSLQSVSDLNTRLKKKIQVYNFRPNIVVDNVDKPYVEDCWREIEVGEVKLTWIAACISYRLKPDTYGEKALFGIDLAPTDEKNNVLDTIGVGDPIRVIKNEPNFWEKKGL